MASVIWIEKEKRWSMRVSINGTIRRFTSRKPGTAGKREVLRKYREFIDGHGVSPILVSDAWNQFTEQVILKNGRTDAFISLDKYGRNYILPKIGKMIVQNVTLLDLQDIINKAKPVSGKEQLSRKTLSNLRSSIMQFVRFCIAAEYMDPLRGELFIPKTAPKKEKVILQPADVRRLFSGPAADDWYINIFRFGCVTGLRIGEILGIQTSDIKNGILTINRSINIRNEITPGKTENARRKIFLSGTARKIIDEQIQRNGPLKTDWIFCSKSGGPLSQSTVRNNWIRIRTDRNLPESASIHSLRHTFISVVKNAMPETMLKQYVGHGAKTQTVELYGHLVSGELQKAAKIIDVNFKELAK